MKKLLVTLKSSAKILDEFQYALKKARSGHISEQHYEVSFDNQKDFTTFIKNIEILMAIQKLKPKSVYELAKLLGKDQSNINKVIIFFESHGVIKIKEEKINNRTVKRPIVEYKKIEFDLSAA
jgi:predicted transcriptional regulator